MWIMLNDSFLSIDKKDCPPGSLWDIARVFGRGVKVKRSPDSDYLYRAILKIEDVKMAMNRAAENIDYENFKESVKDYDLHLAYMRVWSAMSEVQNPRPFGMPFIGNKRKVDEKFQLQE